MLTDEQRVKLELLKEEAHKVGVSINQFLVWKRRTMVDGSPEPLGECIDRVYAKIEAKER